MPFIARYKEFQYPATGALRCIQVLIPDDDAYMHVLAGLLDIPANDYNYENDDMPHAEGVAQSWRDAFLATNWEGCIVPADVVGFMSRITLFQRFCETDGGALALNINANQVFGHYMSDTTPFNSEQFWFVVYLQAGEYEYAGIFVKQLQSAIIDITLEQVGVGVIATIASGIDLHASFATNFQVDGTFTVPSDGEYYLIVNVVGKAAGSSNYLVGCTCQDIWRTGD